jgi:hypothetical protein
MTREEREQYVIQLWKAGRTVRQIAELAHMSLRDIGAITRKVKLQIERERGYAVAEEPQPKSDESRAFKMFSEGKTPVEVVIALDLPAHFVEAKYYEYWQCKRMFELADIYEAKYELPELLRLHRITKRLGMEQQDIIKVLELAKHNQLQYLQWKVQHLENQVSMLELKKTKATNDVLKLSKTIDEFEERFNMYVPWLQQKGQVGYMNHESRMLEGPVNYNAGNLYAHRDANWYALDVYYTDGIGVRIGRVC